jgi:hypothetical protein
VSAKMLNLFTAILDFCQAQGSRGSFQEMS